MKRGLIYMDQAPLRFAGFSSQAFSSSGFRAKGIFTLFSDVTEL